jgi:broad specificity phosphatase PhoE
VTPPPPPPPPGRPLHVLLLRHGLTDANATGTIQGHSPTPLNETGHRQATLLARAVAAWRPRVEALVSSDLRRAVQTAEPVAAACGLAPAYDPAWRERGLGEMEGKTFADREIWRAASGEHDTPGAEPAEAFRSRVREALIALPARFPREGVVAVVTHGGCVRAILSMLADGRLSLAAGQDCVEPGEIANCSILHLACDRPAAGADISWRVGCVNEVAHLAGLESRADAG